MKITLFTANQLRHNYFINEINKIADELYVVQENRTIFPGQIEDHYPKSKLMFKYFNKVLKAENTLFKNNWIKGSKINILPLAQGDLSYCSLKLLNNFLNSDLYIVFGSSFIKDDLVKFLIKKKAINIHMGISPFYKGTDCNFWALYHNNPNLVGATIHLLNEKLDSGPILYHALSEFINDPFLYTMSTVKAATLSLVNQIKSKNIFNMKAVVSDNSQLIKFSRKRDFTDEVVDDFLKKKKLLKNTKKNNINLINPFFLKNN